MDWKRFFESKTLWFNVVCLLVLLAEQTPAIIANPPEWLTAALAYVLIIGNFILRAMTDQPVKFTFKK